MAKGDILNKLKVAGYVTSTDPSEHIEEALDIQGGGSSELKPSDIVAATNGRLSYMEYIYDSQQNGDISSLDGSFTVKHNDEIYTYDFSELNSILSNIDANKLHQINTFSSKPPELIDCSVTVYDLPTELSALDGFMKMNRDITVDLIPMPMIHAVFSSDPNDDYYQFITYPEERLDGYEGWADITEPDDDHGDRTHRLILINAVDVNNYKKAGLNMMIRNHPHPDQPHYFIMLYHEYNDRGDNWFVKLCRIDVIYTPK